MRQEWCLKGRKREREGRQLGREGEGESAGTEGRWRGMIAETGEASAGMEDNGGGDVCWDGERRVSCTGGKKNIKG